MLDLFRISPEQLIYIEPSECIDKPKAVWRHYHNRKLFFQVCVLGLLAVIVMVLPHQAIAQLPQSPIQGLVDASIAVQEATEESIEEAWIEQLPLFMALLNQLAIAVGVISIIVLGLELVQENREWGYFTWQRIVVPVVMIGLIGNIAFMSDVAFGLRNELNELSTNAYTALGVIDLISEARDAETLPQILSEIWKECEATTSEERVACAEDAVAQSNEIIDIEESNYPGSGWVDFYRNVIDEIGSNFLDDGLNVLSIPELYRDVQFAIASPAIMSIFLVVATGIQGAAQMLMELVLFLTAMLLPLAIARSISLGFDPLIQWFMKMLEFAMVKFFYAILVGLASFIYLGAGGVGGSLWFPFLIALLGILFSFAMLSGGGTSIVQAVLGAAGSAASVAYKGFRLR